MKIPYSILVSLALIATFTACSTKSTVVLLPDPDGNVGQLEVSTEGGRQLLDEANESVQTKGSKAAPGMVIKLSDEEIRTTFSEAIAAQPLPPAKFTLYFLPNSNELTGESKAIVPQIIQVIRERESTDIVISGHTDTVGAMEYNFKLSLDRAMVMHEILVANGATPANIAVTSHGEGNPLIKTGDNTAEPRNRRVEVVIK